MILWETQDPVTCRCGGCESCRERKKKPKGLRRQYADLHVHMYVYVLPSQDPSSGGFQYLHGRLRGTGCTRYTGVLELVKEMEEKWVAGGLE